MKILLINNHTVHLADLAKSLEGHDVEAQTYMPGIEFRHSDKDLIILSGGGGEGMEIDDHYERGRLWYQDEMEFVKKCDKPIIGICMGFEVVCRAFGERVQHMGKLVQGFLPVRTTEAGRKLINKHVLSQYESHYWNVPRVSTEQFEILADSDYGIEMVRHRNRPILATQFHPEKGGTLPLERLLAN